MGVERISGAVARLQMAMDVCDCGSHGGEWGDSLEAITKSQMLMILPIVILLPFPPNAPKNTAHTRAVPDWWAAEPIEPQSSLVFAASPLHEGALLRFAGTSVEEVGRAIHQRLGFVSDLLKDDPFSRKW